MSDDLPPPPVSPRGVRRALIEADRLAGAARRRSLVVRSHLAARRVGAGLRLEVHPSASIGRHVVIETWHGTRNVVRIGAGTRIADHTWISMRGGSVEIGAGSDLRRGVTLNCSGRLVIGDGVMLNSGCHVHCAADVRIDDWTIFGEYCSVVDSQHVRTPPDEPIQHATAVAPVHIGRNVWLGAKSTVTAGVRVGDQAVVAGGAVVIRDLPSGSVAAGVPARLVRGPGENEPDAG